MISKTTVIQAWMIYDKGTVYDGGTGENDRPPTQEEIQEASKIIEQYITQSPTSEEVCNALSEYYGDEHITYYSEEDEFAIEHNNTICYLFKEQNNQMLRIKFEAFLPPHLITMIGQFYSTLNK